MSFQSSKALIDLFRFLDLEFEGLCAILMPSWLSNDLIDLLCLQGSELGGCAIPAEF